MNPTNLLALFLFGSPQVFVDGKEETGFNARKDLALLAYLAVTDATHSREHLAGLLWSDLPEDKARRNLRHALSHLQKVIGPSWIETEKGVTLTQHLPWSVDVQTLRSAVDNFAGGKFAGGKFAGNSFAATNGDPDQHAIDRLCDALALYRDEFLQGFYLQNAALFEEWVLGQREEFHLSALQGLELVAHYALAHGIYEKGLAATRRLLQLESYSETGHRLQMQLLAQSGQRAAALAQYERCRQVLADELGVEPMPETLALYKQIQVGTFNAAGVQSEMPIPVVLSAGIPSVSVSITTTATATAADREFVVPNNLSTSLATFIGREHQLTFMSEHLTTDKCRLLTISGPGGIGKTALALESAQRLLHSQGATFPDGIFFVALAGIESKGDAGNDRDDLDNNAIPTMAIITTIAKSIGCQFQGSQSELSQLQDYLRTRRLLLILDNFEHLIEYAELVVTLLSSAPHVTMLITSRLRLNIRGETTLMLKGLSLLATGDTASLHQESAKQASEAVALFVERAQSFDPSFTVSPQTIAPIVQICQLVDGLPLALEMLAAWIQICSCTEIAEKLKREEQSDEFLVSPFGDHPKRHRSLQAVFDDSWALLPSASQRALAKLSIFASQFTLQAAQAVAETSLSDLMRLRNHSLLQVDSDGIYSLHPLIKQFATQKWHQITEHELQTRRMLQQAHSRYYLQELADLPMLRGKPALDAIHKYQIEHAEIVGGWQWAAQQEDLAQIQQSMFGMFRYLELTNQTTEGKMLFAMATATASQSVPTAIWLQVARCHFMRRLAEHDQARKLLEKLVEIATPSLGADTFALCVLGWVCYEQGSYDAAYDCFSTVLQQAEMIANHAHVMESHNGLGAVAFSVKKYASAHQHYQTALADAQQHEDLHYTAIVLGNLAALAQATNALGEAEHYLQMRLQIDQHTKNARQMAVSYQRLGQLALLRDSHTKAEAYFRESLLHFEQFGNSPELAHVLLDLSKSLLRQNQLQQAGVQCLRSLQLAIHAQMTPRILSALTLLAEIRIAEGKKDEAVLLIQIVNHNTQIPEATRKTAQKLQDMLFVELGEDVIQQINQASSQRLFREIGLHLLKDTRIEFVA